MDWGEGGGDNPMREFSSMPQVLGHEVVTEVVALGPEAEGVEIGDRVVLNPWLSCVPRGVSPICPACEVGDLSLCWNFQTPPLAPGIHIGTSSDVPGGWANLMPAHPSMLFPVPDSIPDEVAVFADPFAVSLHAVTRHAPPPGGKVLVYGAGALGTCAIAILRALYPDVEVGVVARFGAQADLARKLGAHEVFAHEPAESVIEAAAKWSGGTARVAHRSPDGVPRWHRRRVRHDLEEGDARGRRPPAEGARHDREGGRARHHELGVHAAVLQGAQLGRVERVRDRGGRRRAQARHPPLPRPRARRVAST